MFTLTPQASAQAAVCTTPAAAVNKCLAVAGALHPLALHPASASLEPHMDRCRQRRLSVRPAIPAIGITPGPPVPVSIYKYARLLEWKYPRLLDRKHRTVIRPYSFSWFDQGCRRRIWIWLWLKRSPEWRSPFSSKSRIFCQIRREREREREREQMESR